MATVRLFAGARAAAGVGQETVDATTIAELRSVLVKRHGVALDRILPVCSVLVDGTTCHDDLMPLNESSTVDILPPFAGG